MKNVVKYVELINNVRVGACAYLVAEDHPLASNGTWLSTSKVVAYDEASGTIETMNTIYKPKG